MWLPKDEKKLLLYYYKCRGGEIIRPLVLNKRHLIVSMRALGDYKGDGSEFENYCEIEKSEPYMRVYEAHMKLEGRRLIRTNEESMVEGYDVITLPDELRLRTVVLTLEGSDLARKYNHWFTRCGLWWQEYRYNPLWIPFAYVAGIISTLITSKLIQLI